MHCLYEVSLLGVNVQAPVLCLVMEYMCLGSLYALLHHQPDVQPLAINWQLRLQVAADAAAGLAFLHALEPPIVHRDFKSPNVLVCAVCFSCAVSLAVCTRIHVCM